MQGFRTDHETNERVDITDVQRLLRTVPPGHWARLDGEDAPLRSVRAGMDGVATQAHAAAVG